MEHPNMTREQIVERLVDTMRESSQENVNWNIVTTETTVGQLGFDSLSVLDLIYDVQQQFGIDFEPEELININTVGELAAFLEDEMKA